MSQTIVHNSQSNHSRNISRVHVSGPHSGSRLQARKEILLPIRFVFRGAHQPEKTGVESQRLRAQMHWTAEFWLKCSAMPVFHWM